VAWSQATPRLRAIIGGLMVGKSQVEIASEMKIDRFKLAQLINARCVTRLHVADKRNDHGEQEPIPSYGGSDAAIMYQISREFWNSQMHQEALSSQ